MASISTGPNLSTRRDDGPGELPEPLPRGSCAWDFDAPAMEELDGVDLPIAINALGPPATDTARDERLVWLLATEPALVVSVLAALLAARPLASASRLATAPPATSLSARLASDADPLRSGVEAECMLDGRLEFLAKPLLVGVVGGSKRSLCRAGRWARLECDRMTVGLLLLGAPSLRLVLRDVPPQM